MRDAGCGMRSPCKPQIQNETVYFETLSNDTPVDTKWVHGCTEETPEPGWIRDQALASSFSFFFSSLALSAATRRSSRSFSPMTSGPAGVAAASVAVATVSFNSEGALTVT